MSRETPERLAYMANQIAANLALESDPVTATAEHIAAFWTPRMRAQLTEAGFEALSPVARDAMASLARTAADVG